jgi:hypothetical protein
MQVNKDSFRSIRMNGGHVSTWRTPWKLVFVPVDVPTNYQTALG